MEGDVTVAIGSAVKERRNENLPWCTNKARGLLQDKGQCDKSFSKTKIGGARAMPGQEAS